MIARFLWLLDPDDDGAFVPLAVAAPSTDEVPAIDDDKLKEDEAWEDCVAEIVRELVCEVLVGVDCEELMDPNTAEEDDAAEEGSEDEGEELVSLAEADDADESVEDGVSEVLDASSVEEAVAVAEAEALAAEAAEAAEDKIELTWVKTELASETTMLRKSTVC